MRGEVKPVTNQRIPIIATCILLIFAFPAFAILPNTDLGQPSKYTYKRGQYQGGGGNVPQGSSSNQRVSISSRLGENFPKGVLSPTFSGRVVGPARFEPRASPGLSQQRTPSKTLAKTSSLPRRTRAAAPVTISGKAREFPKTLFTPTYQARWSGVAKTP